MEGKVIQYARRDAVQYARRWALSRNRAYNDFTKRGGMYKLGVNDVVVEDGDAKLATTGVRAGSTLTLAQALKNIVKFTDHPVEDVIPLMTVNPARAMRMDDRKGSIEVGKDADMVLLDDDLNIAATIGLGRLIYQAD